MTQCAFVSDGTPGLGDHHSDDLTQVFHGAVEPVLVCGYHASRPDAMQSVYAAMTTPPVKEPCKLCVARDKAIAEGTWNVGFRWCPHCGEQWRW